VKAVCLICPQRVEWPQFFRTGGFQNKWHAASIFGAEKAALCWEKRVKFVGCHRRWGVHFCTVALIYIFLLLTGRSNLFIYFAESFNIYAMRF
jgi:hypothetical protein